MCADPVNRKAQIVLVEQCFSYAFGSQTVRVLKPQTPQLTYGGFPKLGVILPPIMENQMEKKMENEMETGFIKGII